ncbi:hypothetical protein D3C81_1459370 [compost metagenome]
MLAAVGQLDAQGAAVLRPPVLVEVEHRGHRAAVVVAEAVQVAAVEAARRVQGEVALVVLEAEEQLAVEALAQAVEHAQVGVGGGRFARGEPLDMIATDALVERLPAGPADRGAGQGAGGVAAATLGGQRGGQFGRQSQCLQRPALAGEVVEDAVEEGRCAVLGHGAFY